LPIAVMKDAAITGGRHAQEPRAGFPRDRRGPEAETR
jgi:hypothetical protein